MASDGRRLSVLVVDDCSDTTGSTVELLRLYGFAATAVSTGREALAAADGTPPDVALLDLELPDMDGCEVARRLRLGPADKRPLLVAVSGHAAEADRQRTTAAGFDLHLAKPADPAELAGLLARFALVLGR